MICGMKSLLITAFKGATEHVCMGADWPPDVFDKTPKMFVRSRTTIQEQCATAMGVAEALSPCSICTPWTKV